MNDVPRYGWGRIAQESLSLAPENRKRFLRSGITTVIDRATVQASKEQKARAQVAELAGCH